MICNVQFKKEENQAKLYFYFGVMNSGKSTLLLQSIYDLELYGINALETNILLFKPIIDTRFHKNEISARIGIHRKAYSFHGNFNFYNYVLLITKIMKKKIKYIFIDEAQFLTVKQVNQLVKIVDELNINVYTYGLRTDFKGYFFPASKRLMEISDKLIGLSSFCYCGAKAIMNIRVHKNGKCISEGDQIQIGDVGTSYFSVCRKHHGKDVPLKIIDYNKKSK